MLNRVDVAWDPSRSSNRANARFQGGCIPFIVYESHRDISSARLSLPIAVVCAAVPPGRQLLNPKVEARQLPKVDI